MALETSRIQAIFFDIDGTLWDSDNEMVMRLERFLQPLYWFLPGRDPRRAARRLVMSLEAPGLYIYSLRFRSELLDRLADACSRRLGNLKAGSSSSHTLIDGVDHLLPMLARRYPLAVVSARPQQSTIEFLVQNKLLRYFKIVVTGHTCQRTKPHPDPVLYAAQKLGLAPQNCLMVGDTAADVLAGRSAGAQTAGVLCGFGEQTELRKAGADLILSTTADLLQVVGV